MAIAGAVAHVGSRFWPCLVALGRQCGLQPPHWRNVPAARCRSQADEPRAIGKTRATGVPGVRVCGRLLVALRPIASRPVVDLLIGDADAIALARVPV